MPKPEASLRMNGSGPRDSWHSLSRFTSARIALGRSGGSQRTRSVLEFRLAHARARDAVREEFHAAALEGKLEEIGFETLRLASLAADRRTFLLRPDLGQVLDAGSRVGLANSRAAWGARDLAVIVSDGLSALAAERHAAPLLAHLVPLLRSAGWTLFPIFVVPFGRVRLQDEIGELAGARHCLMLLGERPGLGSPDSLGAYFTYLPRAGRTDAERNCVSNIRPDGLPPEAAARKLSRLLAASVRLGLSGVALKDAQAPLRL